MEWTFCTSSLLRKKKEEVENNESFCEFVVYKHTADFSVTSCS